MLAAHAGHSGVELARLLGVAESYVRKLRGGWRPTRVRGDLWARLVELDQPAAAAYERPPAWGDESRDYYRGMQAAALRMMRTVVEMQTEIGEALKSEGSAPKPK